MRQNKIIAGRVAAVLLIVCFLATMLTACKKPNGEIGKEPDTAKKKEVLRVYFPLSDNSKLGIEMCEIQFASDEEKLEALMKMLMEGPSSSGMGPAVNPNTILRSIRIEKNQVTLDFSSEFKQFSGALDEAAKIAAVVDTALQVSSVTEVRITVEGLDLVAPSGMPYGFMKYIDYSTDGAIETREVKLYFANGDATGVVAEIRSLKVSEDITPEAFCQLLVEELVKGPNSTTLYRTIPQEATIFKLQLDGEIVTVDFSKEMYTKHWKGTAGEAMTLASIVNTLTEYPEVKRVMLLIEGQPMNIDSVVVEEPLTIMEDMIKQ